MSLNDLSIPRSMIGDQLLAELTDAVGAEYAAQDDLDRIVHTYGRSARDLLRIRVGDIPRVPDVVVYPGDEAEVQLIVDRETAAPWSKLMPLYTNVLAAAEKVYAHLGVSGGSCATSRTRTTRAPACTSPSPSSTTASNHSVSTSRSRTQSSRHSSTRAATLSHHHAVGTEHAAWLEQDISAPGVHMIDGLFTAMDPGRNFNPGKIIAK